MSNSDNEWKKYWNTVEEIKDRLKETQILVLQTNHMGKLMRYAVEIKALEEMIKEYDKND